MPGKSFSFTIPGSPVPKARARVVARPGKKTVAYTPKRTADYEKKVKALALVARQKAGCRKFTGAVSVTVAVYREQLVIEVHDMGCSCLSKRGDADNCLKSALDSLQGVAFDNDRQVEHASIWFEREGAEDA